MYSDFELQGIDEELLNSKTYQSVMRRLRLEETNCALNEKISSTSSSVSSTALIGNATQAVTNMGSMVEGAGAKVFALFR